jgi:hypothetical protein
MIVVKPYQNIEADSAQEAAEAAYGSKLVESLQSSNLKARAYVKYVVDKKTITALFSDP